MFRNENRFLRFIAESFDFALVKSECQNASGMAERLPTLQNGFDPFHRAVIELVHNFGGLHIFAHLFRL